MATDMIDLKSAVFHSRNVADWPVVTTLEGVEFKDADPQGGVRPILSAMPWPGIVPAGWDGPITFAIWLGRIVGGVWHIGCALEFYDGKVWTGAPLQRGYNDWFSVGKGFGELEGLPNPTPGEPLLFMVTHGSQRLKDTSTQPGPKSRQERSNAIIVPFVVNGVQMPTPSVPVDPPVNPPPVNPPIVPPTPSGPVVDEGARDLIAQLSQLVLSLSEHNDAANAETDRRFDAVNQQVAQHENRLAQQDAALAQVAGQVSALNGRVDSALGAVKNAGGWLSGLFGSGKK